VSQDGLDPEWVELSQPPSNVVDRDLYTNLHKLLLGNWIRLSARRSLVDTTFLVVRIYILPSDKGNKYVDRQIKRLDIALQSLLSHIDISPETWRGNYRLGVFEKFDMFATQEEGSLFWMFNKIPSPSPRPQHIKEKYGREAVEDLLDPNSTIPGMKTQLYPYQRRSAALCLQREIMPSLDLDSRLEERVAPDGTKYYYQAREPKFFRGCVRYPSCRGGLLAETMGLGKTVICLALILATKDHLPKVPTQYSVLPERPRVASLSEMVVSKIHSHAVAWRVEFERVRMATGNDLASCRARLENTAPTYDIPMEPIRWNRGTIQPPPKRMQLAATTLVIVPRNLCKQWQSEIRKHVEEGVLRVLVMDKRNSTTLSLSLHRVDSDSRLYMRSHG
jgi:SNF2 family DNA or RNA helicase